MTRDQLEAVIWRHWPTRGTEAGRAVGAILAAADRYAENGDARVRRAVLMEELAAFNRSEAAARMRRWRAAVNQEAAS